MDEAELRSDLATGETPSIEFKRCGNSVGRDTFETICSFANSFGGSIYLGVEDDGNAIGIPEENIVPVKRNVTNVVHNPNVFDPPATLEFEDIVFEGSSLVRIWIPPSPSIHRYKERIFERIEDADVVVSTESQLTALCVRKQNIYTEQRVFPYVEASDLRMDLLPAIRTMATGKRTRHPWNGMTDEDLLHSAGLFGKNFVTGEKGFNLAAVLLLGDADVIRSLCPSYKTDAVVRISDQDRYDDRVIVTSNLIEAFDQLTGFCTKHLPDRFHLEGSVRVSPRDIIVREVISNMLVHREYTSPFPAKLIIDNERLRTENASRAPFMGRITLSDFNPIPKNPLIGAFFNNIGLAEELGSGTRNLYKYTKVYSGAEPVLNEGAIFTTTVPLHVENVEPVAERPHDMLSLARQIALDRGYATVSDLERKGVARRTAQRELAALAQQGTLQAKGNGRARKYFLP